MTKTIKVFIGSSSEGESYARVISDVITSLEGYAVLPWRSASKCGESFNETLISKAGEVDAAIFVATPDDHRMMREHEDLVSRDNVLYEYGLFSGKLGRFRTALVVVGSAVVPTDLLGVTRISLPARNEEDAWRYYKDNSVDRPVREWLQQNLAPGKVDPWVLHTYTWLESETAAKERGDFKRLASKSSKADYLVLRGRDMLSPDGEIAYLRDHSRAYLKVRLLMVDFGSMRDETYNEIKKRMDLQWEGNLSTEQGLDEGRRAFAKELSKDINLDCKLLPADMVPELKLRLYDRRGYFAFYRKIGGEPTKIHKRPVFCVADDASEETGRPQLLATLQHLYDHLWDYVGRPL